jgi:hypothetical protein
MTDLIRLPFRLPAQIGTELFPNAIAAPPILRTDILLQPAPGEALPIDMPYAAALAQIIANRTVLDRASAIHQFFLGQRHNAELSGLDVTAKELAIDGGLRLRYRRLHGRESLDITVVVDARRLLEQVVGDDAAPDGYIAAIFTMSADVSRDLGIFEEDDLGDYLLARIDVDYNWSVTMRLNGVVVATEKFDASLGTPVTDLGGVVTGYNQYVLVVAALGDGLAFQSAQNDRTNPNPLQAKIAPARKDKRLFAYPFYGVHDYALPPYKPPAVDPYHVDNSVPVAIDLTQYLSPASPSLPNAVLPADKRFAKAALGPLKDAANIVTFGFTPTVATGVTWTIDGGAGGYARFIIDPAVTESEAALSTVTETTPDCLAVWAEFYSRRAQRPVVQTWRKQTNTGLLMVHDKPQLIVGGVDVVNAYSAFVVDLTPANMSSERPDAPDDYWWTVDGAGNFTDANGAPRDIYGN